MKLILIVFGLAALCSCGSSSSRKEKSLADMKMGERFNYGLKAMKEGGSSKDARFRSQYDKSATAMLSKGKQGSAGWLSRQKAGGLQDFNGVKTFKADDFKTQTFSEADDKNWMGKKALTERDKVPSFADTTFGTKQSPFGNDTAREGSKMSRDGADVFKTTMNREGSKSQKKNRGPLIIELPEQSKGPAYTEDQVKKLLGRD
jgi:hypothetical protein